VGFTAGMALTDFSSVVKLLIKPCRLVLDVLDHVFQFPTRPRSGLKGSGEPVRFQIEESLDQITQQGSEQFNGSVEQSRARGKELESLLGALKLMVDVDGVSCQILTQFKVSSSKLSSDQSTTPPRMR
jgi:hypothetical protein